MSQTLLPFFEWCEASFLGQMVRDSTWLFPVIESVHLVAFAVIGGTILLLDLRILGFVLRSQPVSKLADEARPWFLWSLGFMWVSGVLLFLSESIKCFYNRPFWIKIIALFIAMIWTATFRRQVVKAHAGTGRPLWGRLVAIVSLVLWGTVAWGGRWIGFWG